MNKLQKEFEKTGYNSWINSDIYPDGKIYTKEYTEWLEKRLVKLLDLPHVSGSLPLADLFDEIEGIIWFDSKTQRMKFDDIKRKWVGRQ